MVMIPPEVQTMFASMGSATLYSFIFYLKKRARKDKQTFDKRKLLATLIVGAGVGAFYAYYGIPVTQPSVTEKLATYVGTIALVESLLKTVYRFVNKQFLDE